MLSSLSGNFCRQNIGSLLRNQVRERIVFCSLSSTSTSSSVSKEEVTKFSDMANEWWDVQRNPLISMNPTRVSHIIDIVQTHRQNSGETLPFCDDLRTTNDPLHINSDKDTVMKLPPLTGIRALDIGCGGGLLSESLARLGADVTAIDPSIAIADSARKHSLKSLDSRLSNINYRGGVSVEDLADEYFSMKETKKSKTVLSEENRMSGNNDLNSELFDIICVLEVIEHTTKPEQLLAAASRLLKKPTSEDPNGGILFVSTINRTCKSYALAVLGAEFVLGLLPIGTHDWNKFRKPVEVKNILEKDGLKVLGGVHGMIPQINFGAQIVQWTLNAYDTDVNWICSYSHHDSQINSS